MAEMEVFGFSPALHSSLQRHNLRRGHLCGSCSILVGLQHALYGRHHSEKGMGAGEIIVAMLQQPIQDSCEIA